MGAELDLDDVAATSPKAVKDLATLRLHVEMLRETLGMVAENLKTLSDASDYQRNLFAPCLRVMRETLDTCTGDAP